jgi:hypothetical protein
MKILSIIPAPAGAMLVYETGRKTPLICLALCDVSDGDSGGIGAQMIYPCTAGTIYGVIVNNIENAKVVL